MKPLKRITPAYENMIDNLLTELIDHVDCGIDLGCGNGSMADVIKRHVNYLIGVEKDKWKLTSCRRTGFYDELVHADIREYEIPAKVDVVFLFEVLEHLMLEDAIEFLNRTEQIIILSTPEKYFPIARNGHLSVISVPLLTKLGFEYRLTKMGPILLGGGRRILAYRRRLVRAYNFYEF